MSFNLRFLVAAVAAFTLASKVSPVIARNALWSAAPWLHVLLVAASYGYIRRIRRGQIEIYGEVCRRWCCGWLEWLSALFCLGIAASLFMDLLDDRIRVVIALGILHVAWFVEFNEALQVELYGRNGPIDRVFDNILPRDPPGRQSSISVPPAELSEERRKRTEARTAEIAAETKHITELAALKAAKAKLEQVRASLPWWRRFF